MCAYFQKHSNILPGARPLVFLTLNLPFHPLNPPCGAHSLPGLAEEVISQGDVEPVGSRCLSSFQLGGLYKGELGLWTSMQTLPRAPDI